MPPLSVKGHMTTIGSKFSKAGSIASLICAVHCALTPLALVALPVIAAHSWHGLDGVFGVFWAETTEWVFLATIVVLAGFGLLVTCPLHRDFRPAWLTGLGLGILVISHVWVESRSSHEVILDVLGASLIAWAGFWNRRLCQQLGCHTHDSEKESCCTPVGSLSEASVNR